MKTALVLLVACFLVVSVIPCRAATTLELYDNFKKAAVDPAKWDGYESYQNYAGPGMETAREIRGGALRLTQRAHGLITTDTSAASKCGQRLRMIDGSNVTTMRGTVTVTKAVLHTPVSGPEAMIRARIGGYFFNVGTPTPGDATGDVVAEIGLFRSTDYTGPKDIGIFGYVYQCLDSGCNTSNNIGVTQEIGRAQVGQPAHVAVQWDKANQQFIFKHITSNKTESQNVTYTVSDASPPGWNNKRLRVDAEAPPCAAAPCTEAHIEALFGPVYINSGAGAVGPAANMAAGFDGMRGHSQD